MPNQSQTKQIQPENYLKKFPISALLVRAALKKGIGCQIFKRPFKGKKILYLKFKQGEKIEWICPQRGYFNSKASCDLTLFKYLTNQILISNYLPASQMKRISRVGQLNQLDFQPPWVIKPVAEEKGSDVILSINQFSQLKKYAQALLKKYPSLIIEKQIRGKDYRILVLDNQVLAVSRKKPPRIKGDGQQTIRGLIGKINQKRKIRPVYFKPYLKPILIDQHLKKTLNQQGYRLNSKLAKGKSIYLRQNGNFSTGGKIQDVTEQIHPQNKKIALQAIKALGLRIGGVDVIAQEISRPIRQNQSGIIEVNSGPGIWTHHFPNQGQSRNIAQVILDYLF